MIRVAIGMLLALAVAAPAMAQQENERCPAQLPPAIAAKRAAILAAAKKGDLDALKGLASNTQFIFSYGSEAEDPVVLWREQTKHGTDVAKILAAIISMNCVMGEGGSVVWPSAVGIDWSKLRPEEQNALVALYGKKIDGYWLEGRSKGYYVGWVVTIEPDGSWSSFVAGD